MKSLELRMLGYISEYSASPLFIFPNEPSPIEEAIEPIEPSEPDSDEPVGSGAKLTELL